MSETKNKTGLDQVRCRLHATCQKYCPSKKLHDAASCNCVCEFNDRAKCVALAPQDFMASEADGKVPGPEAAR